MTEKNIVRDKALEIAGAICAILVIILVSGTFLGDPFWWMPW